MAAARFDALEPPCPEVGVGVGVGVRVGLALVRVADGGAEGGLGERGAALGLAAPPGEDPALPVDPGVTAPPEAPGSSFPSCARTTVVPSSARPSRRATTTTRRMPRRLPWCGGEPAGGAVCTGRGTVTLGWRPWSVPPLAGPAAPSVIAAVG